MRPLDCQAGGRALREIAEDPEGVLERKLLQLLERSAATEFGRKHGLSAIRSLAEYQARVPPTPYEEIRPYVSRMIEEDAGDLLFPGRATFFAQTSGTSGDAKLFPYTQDEADHGALRMGSVAQGIEDAHPGSMRAPLALYGRAREATTPCGVPIGSASGHILTLLDHPLLAYLPPAIWELADFDARYYTVLRLAIPRPVRMLGAFNPSTILMLFDKGTQFGPRLVRDLRAGGIAEDVPLPPEVRAAIAPHLAPSAEAADRLERVLQEKGRFDPLAIWPELTVVVTWKAGMCSHYLPGLQARVPGRPIFSCLYSASEGIIAVPLRTEWTGGVPALMETVLEFYPADATPEPGTFVPLTRLEPARDYRMLLTNHRGLYRYPLDDVIRVEAWHGKAPVIAFSHRYGNTSSLTGEKLTEVQINAAMERALGGRALRPKEFQVAPLWGSPPRYLVVVEFEGRDPSDDELRELAQALDRAITTLNVEYASKRKTDRLGPPVLGLLRSGEFERMRRARTADRGRSDAQVKIPRLIRELVKVEDYAIQRLTSER